MNIFEIESAERRTFLLDLYKLDREETAKREFEARKLYDQTILRVSTAALIGTLLGQRYLVAANGWEYPFLFAFALLGFILAIIFVLISLRYSQLAQDAKYDYIWKEYILRENPPPNNHLSESVTWLGMFALLAVTISLFLSLAFFFLNSTLWTAI